MSLSVFEWMYFARHQLSGMCRSRKESLLLVLPVLVLAQSCKISNILHGKSTEISQLTIICLWPLWNRNTSAKSMTFCNSVKTPGHFLAGKCEIWRQACHVLHETVLSLPLLVLGCTGHLPVKLLELPHALKLCQPGLQHLFNSWTLVRST